jgi:pentalenolactone synthase
MATPVRTHAAEKQGSVGAVAIPATAVAVAASREPLNSGGVLRLLVNPDQRATLAADPALLASAVEEILRSALPPPRDDDEQRTGLMRYAREDIDFDGAQIAAGELVLLGLRTANQDTVHFPDPARFDITRMPNPHLSFGFGPRFCLGAPLARLELQVLFAALLHRPDLRLAVPPDELRPRRDILTGGLQALPVTWST